MNWLEQKQDERKNNRTRAERKMEQILKEMELDYESEVIFNGLRYICDFVLHKYKLIIEIDGAIHSYQCKRDARRDIDIQQKTGYRILRLWNEGPLYFPDKVKTIVLEYINGKGTKPKQRDNDTNIELWRLKIDGKQRYCKRNPVW